MAEASSGRRLLNATAVMASGTMVSRILGFVRAMLLAAALGNGGLRPDLFAIALLVPNSLYMLLAGGTLNNVLVPQIVRAVVHDKDEGKAFIDRIVTAFLLALGVLTVLLTVAVPWVMTVYASRWQAPGLEDAWQNLLLMSYITMPQLFFYGVFFLIGQILNARDVFGPMMWAPIANNVVSIAVFGAYIGIWGANAASGTPFTTEQVWLLGAGSTLGIVIQTLVLVPYLKKAGIRYRPRFDLKGTGLGRTFHVAKWMVGYVALTSLAQVVVTNLASTASAADVTAGAGLNAYQQAYLIWILPHSLLTVSLATALLPAASRAAAAGNLAGVTSEAVRALRLATTFLVPASLGLLVLADPITRLAFGHGSGSGDYHLVSFALMAFAIGLVPFTIQYLYLRAFYALDDTRTPFLLQIWISGANAALAVAFVLPFDDPATVAARLALSYTVAYVLGLWLTHRALGKRIPGLPGRETIRHLVRLGIATLPAAALAWAVTFGFSQLSGVVFQVVGLVLAGGLAVGAFFFTAKRMGIPEAAELLGLLRRGRTASEPADPALASEDIADAPLLVEELLADAEESARWREFAPPSGEGPGASRPLADARTSATGNGSADGQPPIPENGGLPVPASGEPPVPEVGGTPGLEGPEDEELNPNPDGEGVFVPVSAPEPPETLLEFPEPTRDESEDEPTNLVDVGRMLAGRYQLAELLASRDGQRTWRAEDTVLARNVLIQVLADGDPRGPRMLELARRAAMATDSRFLRVLDVVEATPGEHGVYIVYEYAPGQTLQRVLESGPLTGAETAWIVREVSDAVALLHADGLTHGHLSPATVLITPTGNVKIIGLLVDEAADHPPVSPEDARTEDVEALGRMLYACLVARWPGGERYGLPAAPVSDGQVVLPSQVRSGVAHPVDVVVDRILSAVPRQGASPLLTAQDVTTELSLVLGPSSAAADLRLRLGHSGPGIAAVSAVTPPVPTPAHPRYEVSERVPAELTGDPTEAYVRPEETPPPFTPVPPPSPEAVKPAGIRRPSLRQLLLGLFLAVVVVVLLVYLAVSRPQGPGAATVPTPTPTPTPVAVAIVKGYDFDPREDGGSGQENPKLVPLAFDGDPATAWTTERYRTKPTFGGLKPGAGLVLDLGKAVPVRAVKLTLGEGSTALEVRVPAAATTGDEPPLATQQDWRAVAKAASGSGTFSLGFGAESTRYVLVYLTELPPVEDAHYRGAIAEVQVLS